MVLESNLEEKKIPLSSPNLTYDSSQPSTSGSNTGTNSVVEGSLQENLEYPRYSEDSFKSNTFLSRIGIRGVNDSPSYDLESRKKIADMFKMAQSGNETVNEDGHNYHESRTRHPNFHKKDERLLNRENSYIHLSGRADKNLSRYFINHSPPARFLDKLEGPYYYLSEDSTTQALNGSSDNSNNSFISQDKKQDIVQRVRTVEAEKDDLSLQNLLKTDESPREQYRLVNLSGVLMTDQDNLDLKDNSTGHLKHFGKNFYKPKYWNSKNKTGYLIATIGLLALIVFGSVGFLVSYAKKYYGSPDPEVYEILSPYQYPTLAAIRTSLIDPDTPKEAYEMFSSESKDTWKLVFSDEFNAEGRTFYEGEDQFFTAQDIHYAATSDLEFYVPDMIQTKNGTLQIKIDAFPTNGLDYRSGMLQSWNKLCFNKNAKVVVSIKMPAYSQSRGLWPAIWSLGNLARAGFQATTDGVWPYTYDECDFGITPNQSSPDGISYLPGQRLSRCTCFDEDHPSPGIGRGAPEIDIIEGSHDKQANWGLGVQTLQVAPFDPWWRPDYSYMKIRDKFVTFMKEDTGTPTQEAIAAITVLNNTWFDSVRNDSDNKEPLDDNTHFQTYGYEYMSAKTNERDSYIQFFLGNDPTLTIYGDALHPETGVGWRQISREPMSLVFNLGLSPTWMDIDFASLELPAVLEVDYVRIYQPKDSVEMTCDPVDYPTTDYINRHMNAYTNFNLTSWEQAGYRRPKNKMMDGCEAPVPVF